MITRLVASRRAGMLLELTGVNHRRLRKGPLGNNLRIVLSTRHLSDRLRVEDHDYVFTDAVTAGREIRNLIASLTVRACRLEDARGRAAGTFICPVLAHVLKATGHSLRDAIAAARSTGVLIGVARPSIGIAWRDGILGCRFDLDCKSEWDCGTLTVPALPEQVVLTLKSRRLGELIRHPLLPPDLLVAKAATIGDQTAVHLKVLGYAVAGKKICTKQPLTRRWQPSATWTT